MALNQTNKLAWIVETIQKARKITFEELKRKWMNLNGYANMLQASLKECGRNIRRTKNERLCSHRF